MDLTTRKTLREALTRLSTELAAALRTQLLASGPTQERARVLHGDEKVGDAFELWTDLLSRRAAVLWVLKSLYVRALEDRGLLRPGRLLDAESEQLFAQLAPNLGPTAYLRWVFRDLSTGQGGLPELFAPQPAELGVVPDALSRKLIELWRSRDPDTGVLRFRFDDEHFDGRLLGDLYQDLDPVVKKRYALLQTPDFVLDFILDETLTPAIAEFGIETVRVLDPACGSGHFLLAAFKRLVTAMREKDPERPVREVVQDVLRRVVGIDLNDYACGLARARLVMTALELCGETDLSAAHDFHPQVYWADALEQVERETPWVQQGLGLGEATPRSSVMLGRPEVRSALAPVLRAGFHAIAGNPPFDAEKDARARAYHREEIGGRRRYVSATGRYALSAPFTERSLALTVRGGFVGLLLSNSFAKNEFGRALVEDVLRAHDLVLVVDTSGVCIPGAASPTVIVVARRQSSSGAPVPVVKSKRRERFELLDPSAGRVWKAIHSHYKDAAFDDEVISVETVDRAILGAHPWSLGGGGVADLKALIESKADSTLGRLFDIGVFGMTNADEVFVRPAMAWRRVHVEPEVLRPSLDGGGVRNWACGTEDLGLFPYADRELMDLRSTPHALRALWPWRAILHARATFSGGTYRSDGLPWWQWHQVTWDRIGGAFVAFAELSSHNQFCSSPPSWLLRQSAMMAAPHKGSSDENTSAALAQVNSSSVGFWIKQVCRDMGGGGNGRGISDEVWEPGVRQNATKLKRAPLVLRFGAEECANFSHVLVRLGADRLADSVGTLIAGAAAAGVPALRTAVDARRTRDLARLAQMVALQEELDWLCYRLYGIDPDAEVRAPDAVPPLSPGLRPFEVTLAREDAERRATLVAGEEPDEQPTAWFERHRWAPHTTLDALPVPERAIVQARLDRTAASRDLSLLEQPTYKRRWYRPDHDKEEREALTLWLQDRVEDWAKTRKEPFTVAQAAAALRSDPAVLAVGELLTGRADFDVDALVGEQINDQAVPTLKTHVFKPEGLRKRAQWEETWRLQHQEDAGEKVTPPVPPKYDTKDYLRAEYWSLRGKLDVPKERFLALSEVPSGVSVPTLFGWAGWTARERANVLLGLDEKAESAGVPVPERYGLLYSAWFLLPYVGWEDAKAAADLRADVRGVVGEQGVTEAMLEAWAATHPPRGRERPAPRAGTAAKAKTPVATGHGGRKATRTPDRGG